MKKYIQTFDEFLNENETPLSKTQQKKKLWKEKVILVADTPEYKIWKATDEQSMKVLSYNTLWDYHSLENPFGYRSKIFGLSKEGKNVYVIESKNKSTEDQYKKLALVIKSNGEIQEIEDKNGIKCTLNTLMKYGVLTQDMLDFIKPIE